MERLLVWLFIVGIIIGAVWSCVDAVVSTGAKARIMFEGVKP